MVGMKQTQVTNKIKRVTYDDKLIDLPIDLETTTSLMAIHNNLITTVLLNIDLSTIRYIGIGIEGFLPNHFPRRIINLHFQIAPVYGSRVVQC